MTESHPPFPSPVDKQVLDFYKTLPFNYFSSPKAEAERIRKSNEVKNYNILAPIINKKARIIDVGCGTGRLSNSIAYHYGCPVTGIDFNAKAIEHAKQVAGHLNINVQYRVVDLFEFTPANSYDIAISIGVLHHTHNCMSAIRLICRNYIAPGGYFFAGLYHVYGRRPFLNYFNGLKKAGMTNEELFLAYKKLNKEIKDDLLLRSWFRDQVLHPNETQHTMSEIYKIAADEGMEIVSTSINHFEKIDSVEKVFDMERSYEDLSLQRLKEEKYFPGFFLFLTKKKVSI